MVIDTSILVAVILKEQGFEQLVFKMAEADTRYQGGQQWLRGAVWRF